MLVLRQYVTTVTMIPLLQSYYCYCVTVTSHYLLSVTPVGLVTLVGPVTPVGLVTPIVPVTPKITQYLAQLNLT